MGPADSLSDQGYLLLERENQPESANTKGQLHTCTHAHTHRHGHLTVSTLVCSHTLTQMCHCLHKHTHLAKRLNRLIAGTPLRKQQPNYQRILYQGHLLTAHTHTHLFILPVQTTSSPLTKSLGYNKGS